MKKIRGYRVLLALLLMSATISTYAIEMKVVLLNSSGDPIEGAHVKYLANTWKNFGLTDENGEATKNIDEGSYSFRMIHNGITAEIGNFGVSAGNDFLLFETVNYTIHFKDSEGAPLAGGAVSYFGTGWTLLGATDEDGNVYVEILPGTTSFKMEWEGRTEERVDVIIDPLNPMIEFQTVKMVVKLVSSSGEGTGGGIVDYKPNGWEEFGITSDGGGGGHHDPSAPGGGGCGTGGGTNKQILPGVYSFRMTFEDKTITVEDVDTGDPDNIPLVFTTVKMVIKLKDSNGDGLAGGYAEFNSSGWKEFGITKNQGGGSSGGGGGCGGGDEGGGCGGGDEGGHDPGCPGSTGGSTSSSGGCGGGSGGSGGSGSGGGCSGGGCGGGSGSGGGCGGGGGNGGGGSNGGGPGGVVHKELLPGSYSFRMTWEGATVTEANVNIEEASPLLFHTAKTIVRLVDSDGVGLVGGMLTFFSDSWRDGGTTNENGEALLELLPKDYLFNMEYLGETLVKATGVTPPETTVEFEWDGDMLKNSTPIVAEDVTGLNIFPNPSSGPVNIGFSLEAESHLDVCIVDLKGRLVDRVFNGVVAAGNHQLIWNANAGPQGGIKNGVYLCRIKSGDKVQVKSFIFAE